MGLHRFWARSHCPDDGHLLGWRLVDLPGRQREPMAAGPEAGESGARGERGDNGALHWREAITSRGFLAGWL